MYHVTVTLLASTEWWREGFQVTYFIIELFNIVMFSQWKLFKQFPINTNITNTYFLWDMDKKPYYLLGGSKEYLFLWWLAGSHSQQEGQCLWPAESSMDWSEGQCHQAVLGSFLHSEVGIFLAGRGSSGLCYSQPCYNWSLWSRECVGSAIPTHLAMSFMHGQIMEPLICGYLWDLWVITHASIWSTMSHSQAWGWGWLVPSRSIRFLPWAEKS
jgi:hypothetical protein